MRDENPTTLASRLATLQEYMWHAVNLATIAVLSVLIWAAPAWVVALLVRLGITPSPAAWEVFLENGAVVVLLVSFLVVVVESELKLHLYNARNLLALYRALRERAPSEGTSTPALSESGSPEGVRE